MQIVMPSSAAQSAASTGPIAPGGVDAPVPPTAPLPPVPAAGDDALPVEDLSYKNPAATAALRSTVEILKGIEDGIVKNYTEVEKVRSFANDLHAAADIVSAASDAIMGDANKDNDQFLPLITQAGARVSAAEIRLSAKELSSTWPSERSSILDGIRHARVISSNIADQLDPNAVPAPRR